MDMVMSMNMTMTISMTFHDLLNLLVFALVHVGENGQMCVHVNALVISFYFPDIHKI